MRWQKHKIVVVKQPQSRMQGRRRQDVVSLQLIRYPQHAAYFDSLALCYSTQQSISGEENAVPDFLGKRQGKQSLSFSLA